MEGFLYIIQSTKNGQYYIGASENPDRRLSEHNTGQVVATRNKGPWENKYLQKFQTLTIAKKIEIKLKKLKRRDILKKIIEEGIIKLKVD